MTSDPAAPAAPASDVRAYARAALRLGVAPAAIYLALFVALTWPAAATFRTRILGGEGDAYQNIWNLWHLERVVTHGAPVFRTDALHHPFGVSLRGHTLGLWNGALGVPLARAVGREVAYNVILVGSFVACGLTAFLLAHRLTRSWPGALVAGFAFTFSHWHMARGHGHLNLVAAEWLPPFALAWLALLDRPGHLRAALAALALLLATLCDLYFLAACAFTGVTLLAGRALDEGRAWLLDRERLRALASFGALAFAATAPLTLPLASLHARDPLRSFNEDPRLFSADLLMLVAPGCTSRWADLTAPLWSRFAFPDSASVSLGLPVVVLLAWLWRRRAEVEPAVRLRAWYLLALAAVVLGLGPELQVGGRPTGVPLPWALLDGLPPVRLAGKPTRLLVVATLATSVLVAAGVARLLAGRRPWLAGAFAAALLLDHLPALPTTTAPLPAYARALRDGGEGAVLDLAGGHYRALYYQTFHERPMALGYLARWPTSLIERERPLLAAYERGDWAALRERYRVRWLALPANAPPPQGLRRVAGDAQGALYELSPHPFR